MVGSVVEGILIKQSEKCIKESKEAIKILAFSDAANVILAVKSDRADLSLGLLASASYYINKSGANLEFIAVDEDFPLGQENYQAILLTKNSKLTPVIYQACKVLFENGTYARIMKKWYVDRGMIPAPMINLKIPAN